MRNFYKLMLIGIVLMASSCVKNEFFESDFLSMNQAGNVVVLTTNLSSIEVVLNTKELETYNQTDTISCEIFKVEEEFSYGKVCGIKTGNVVKQIHNFKVVEKNCDVNLYLPVKKQNGSIGQIKTRFSFMTEVPVLNDHDVSVSVDVDCDFVKFVQDPECKEPYSTLTYCFHLTVIQNDQEVEHFSFERDFAWENKPIAFDPSVEDWE